METKILAPLTGKIVSIESKPGDTVVEDQEVLVIEAMKMETPIYAPNDGIIDKIVIKEGDDVEEDDLLIILK